MTELDHSAAGHRLNVVIDAATIAAAVERIAREIVHDLPPNASVLVIGILEGARPFANDLVRNLRGIGVFRGLTVEQDWMKASSYHGGLESTGHVEIVDRPQSELRGKHVLLVDDIIDQGHTLAHIADLLEKEEPESVKICVLLDKPSGSTRRIRPDYTGLESPKKFIVGYGLDYQENYRNLPYLASLSFDASEVEGFGLAEN